MANLSDWLGTLAASAQGDAITPGDTAPGWLALLADAGGAQFREAPLFGASDPGSSAPQPPPAPEPAAPEPDPLAEAAERAFADGVAAGRAAAEAEGEALMRRQRALRLNFRTLDEAASAVLADDLAATVLALCEGVLGEAARDPAGLRARAAAAARRIGGAPDRLALHLHPDDVALVDAETIAAMRVVPDPGLEPGSVMIEGPDGTVTDGPAEWRRALAAMVRG